MENNFSNELQHWGIKGQKWGQRRYQNPDGTLTPAGKKRYNKEVEKLKAEEAKIKTAEKIAANRQKTQSKIDKLDAKRQELEERKKALKSGKRGDTENDKPEETVDERREKALKSTNAKEIYENRDVLTYQELNDRLNRIDLEARLQSRIPPEPPKKTVMDRVDKAATSIGKATELYKKIDGAYSAFTTSAIGKQLAKSMGLDVPEKKPRESLDDFLKRVDSGKVTNKEINEYAQSEANVEKMLGYQVSRRKAAAKAAEEAARMNNKNSQKDKQSSKNEQNNNQKNDNQQNDQKQNDQKADNGQKPDKQNKDDRKQNDQKKVVDKKMSDAEINKKVQEAAKELEAAAKRSDETKKEVEVNTKQLEALLDEYGDFFFLE